jgi:hypothetical protein
LCSTDIVLAASNNPRGPENFSILIYFCLKEVHTDIKYWIAHTPCTSDPTLQYINACYMCTLHCYWAAHIFSVLSFFTSLIFPVVQCTYSLSSEAWFFPAYVKTNSSHKFQEVQFTWKLCDQKIRNIQVHYFPLIFLYLYLHIKQFPFIRGNFRLVYITWNQINVVIKTCFYVILPPF